MAVIVLAALAAIGLLTAYLTDERWVAWATLMTSVVGAALATWLLVTERAREGVGHGAVSTDITDDEPSEASDSAEDELEDGADVRPVPEAVANEVVFVIPGRRRFHLAGCSLLEGRQYEEITADDALDEGFTPCSRCVDTAAGDDRRELRSDQ
jgi:hypothetical protein